MYRTQVFSEAPPLGWTVLVDAHSGHVVRTELIQLHSQGYAYAEDPTYGEPDLVDLTELEGDGEVLVGRFADVSSTAFDEHGKAYAQHLAVADKAGDFLYEADPESAEDAFAEVQTYHHLTEISRHYLETYGHHPGQMDVTTNYRPEPDGTYSNAYMTKDQLGTTLLVFGQGFIDFSYDADVVAHEFGHGVIYDASAIGSGGSDFDEWGENTVPGAFHEGIADYIAASWYGNAVVGEYWGGRDLDNDHTCSGDLVGEVHEDGKIFGGAMWDVREIVGPDLAEELMFAMFGEISGSPTFAEVAEVVTSLTEALADDGVMTEEQATQVAQVFVDRGMDLCGRSITLLDGVPLDQTLAINGPDLVLPDERCDRIRERGFFKAPTFQYAIVAPTEVEGTLEGIELSVAMSRTDGQPLEEGDLQYTLHLRKDVPITFDYSETQSKAGHPILLTEIVDFDAELVDMSATNTIAGDGGLELEAGATYFISLTHINCVAAEAVLTANVLVTPPEATDDDASGGETKRSCGCAATPGLGWVPVLFGLGMVAVRRRS